MDSSKSKTAKRSRNDSGPDPEGMSHPVPDWPRFLVIEGSSEDQPLRGLSPFAVSKGIEGLIGSAKSVKRLRSGDILVETLRPVQADSLLKATLLVGVPIKVSPHRSLNSSKGVLRCPELRTCDDKEVQEGLASQGVTHVYRIMITRDGNRLPTGTFIVTFSSPTPPAMVKVGYLQVKVDTYIPNPIRCFKCQRYGHFKSNCKKMEACEKCGREDHITADCKEVAHCINCDGSHPANSRTCPKWIEEKEIQKIKATGNMTYTKAKDMYHSQNNRLRTFAAAVKRTSSTSTPTLTPKTCQSISTQTDFVWPQGTPQPQPYWQLMLHGKKSSDKNLATSNTQTQPNRNRSQSKDRHQSAKGQKEDPKVESRKSRSTEKKITCKSSKVTTQENTTQKKTKPPTQSNRQQKGSKDPILLHNKYEALSSGDDMDLGSPSSPHSPPRSKDGKSANSKKK